MKPYVNRSVPHPTPANPTTTPRPPIRMHTPAPQAPPQVPPAARVFSAAAADPNSRLHLRWDEAKRTELSVFCAMGCMKAVPITAVPKGV